MKHLDFSIIVIIVGTLILFTSILRSILISKSYNYIEIQKEYLFDSCHSISRYCKELGIQLMNQLPKYNFTAKEMGLNQSHYCTNLVFSNASNSPIQYLLKYSHLRNDKVSLDYLDFFINFNETLLLFHSQMDELSRQITSLLPMHVRLFTSKKDLAYTVCNVSVELINIKNPIFSFIYSSPAGRVQNTVEIEITTTILNDLISEISKNLNFQAQNQLQRNAMTNDLRNAIKARDNYTCCICGNSVLNEPNLLLEVDHIIPISKDGKTTPENLQTLCWRCNRSKGNK